MRIFNVRANHEQEDIARARQVIDAELAHPSKNIMFIWGSTPEVDYFADLAAARCDPFPNRECIWVKHEDIFLDEHKKSFLDGRENMVSVVLDIEDVPQTWLKADASLTMIEKALLKAGLAP